METGMETGMDLNTFYDLLYIRHFLFNGIDDTIFYDIIRIIINHC
jgi:hypothetical protein